MMLRNALILLVAAVVVALPFAFRRNGAADTWQPGDPRLVIITSHNEAIRHEFARAFSAWHEQRHGAPVRIDWRAIGGTTEILRYLEAEFVSAFRAYWRGSGQSWGAAHAQTIMDRRFRPDQPPADLPPTDAARAEWEQRAAAYQAFRVTDDPAAFSSQIDLFFGGGEYDHSQAHRRGLTVEPWAAGAEPAGLFVDAEGRERIPAGRSGEIWRTPAVFGAALSTFGICYNLDRLRDLGLSEPPRHWEDLADPRYFRQVGLADPTKSGSISKAFEMMIHQKCYQRVRSAGYSDEEIDRLEALPAEEIPSAYDAAVAAGWADGIALVQRLGANARYFTDSASKVPIDVSQGDAAAGLTIDFYGRYQAELSRDPAGRARMEYVTPAGGSSVSADPISLLRGAPHRDLALRFMEFVLSEEGQRLWNYAPGTPGGPEKYALRRLPIRADFYPGALGEDARAAAERHAPHLTDPLADPSVNPYVLADDFTYRSRWTGRHFNLHRDLIRAMCLDSAQELQRAWAAILARGGPEAQPEAMRLLRRLPDSPRPITWQSLLDVPQQQDRLAYMRAWTLFFRQSYQEAERAAEQGGGAR